MTSMNVENIKYIRSLLIANFEKVIMNLLLPMRPEFPLIQLLNLLLMLWNNIQNFN